MLDHTPRPPNRLLIQACTYQFDHSSVPDPSDAMLHGLIQRVSRSHHPKVSTGPAERRILTWPIVLCFEPSSRPSISHCVERLQRPRHDYTQYCMVLTSFVIYLFGVMALLTSEATRKSASQNL